ncbi:hypothetical protein JCGZ_14371 [Jatropha curcas]|uniref:EGF-like domain-containing protein n=1 Tax=Jatropha curcas TaxID=180498 RepID=A0A067K8K1_JATCU|nr:uncharacterized protein LOC105642955 isoform X2 [Jatropha curcas]KDP28600.1 hypothetical protein JCGZ_14371 [Jatropha curcas]
MADNSILCCSCYTIPTLFLLLSSLFGYSHSINEQLGSHNSFTVSSFRYPESEVKPYDLRYIRVDLPPWFSSLSIAVESDVDLDAKSISKVPKSTLPMICFRDGSPPLPDVLNISLVELGPVSNSSFEALHGPENVQCYPMQKNIMVKLTNEQISPGVWYLGLFNGIGPTRTQSKMIIRSPAYSFSANVSVEGCTTSTMWGQYCNQTIDSLSCSPSDSFNPIENVSNADFQTTENVVSCKNVETSCLGEGEVKVYSLEVQEVAEQLIIMIVNVSSSTTLSSNAFNASGTNLTYFVRHGAMPSIALHDYSGDLNKASLVIRFPKIGRWFIAISPSLSNGFRRNQNISIQICYSFKWQVLQCPLGKAGFNCTSERYVLETVLRRDSSPFESYYLPVSGKVSPDSANFPLEPLLSNASYGGEPDNSWTYFLLNIPRGAAGGNIHVRLTSDTKINYEIYARVDGFASLDNWDYYYANKSRSSDGSAFFLLYNSSEGKVDFYILYVQEGTWTFGLRNLNSTNNASNDQTIMSVSVERCARKCSSHGECKVALDASGLTSYSFCSCDRTHGGFDCSVEIVSHQGHIKQSIALIASNAAALFPAYWALRKKAFAEWVLFTSSGISSGLYHACDVGTWCALSFGVLQFMDFWLSFMAVVSTFVYLTTINEAYKRTIQTVVAILTALMAITKATRSSNIILVMSIGACGLLIGWLIEFSTHLRSFSFPTEICLNMPAWWHTIRRWFNNLLKTLLRRFRWGFLLVGFTALAMAAISWKLESTESYWIWHSMWHITIYTSSFFFLCSKVETIHSENQTLPDGNYALTRQDSFPRGE